MLVHACSIQSLLYIISKVVILEDSSLLGCENVLLGKWVPTLLRSTVSSSPIIKQSWKSSCHYVPLKCQESLNLQHTLMKQKEPESSATVHENLKSHFKILKKDQHTKIVNTLKKRKILFSMRTFIWNICLCNV